MILVETTKNAIFTLKNSWEILIKSSLRRVWEYSCIFFQGKWAKNKTRKYKGRARRVMTRMWELGYFLSPEYSLEKKTINYMRLVGLIWRQFIQCMSCRLHFIQWAHAQQQTKSVNILNND